MTRSTIATDIDDARRLERQRLLERVDGHPWSCRVDACIDACVRAFDRGKGLDEALRLLLEEVGRVRGELVAAYPPTLGEPALAAMGDVQYLAPILGAMLEAATTQGHKPMFRTLLLHVLTEVAAVTRRAVLQVAVPSRRDLTAHGIRRALES